MDFVLIAVYGLLCVCSSLLGGFIARLLFDSRAYMNIEGRIISLENSIKGKAGQAAKVDKQIRITQAMQEGTTLLSEGKKPMEIAQLLAPKYPDIALELWKEIKKNGF